MELIIDASNIRAGGGLTHLREILAGDAAARAGFTKVHLWAPDSTLRSLADHDWLEKCAHVGLNGGYRARWDWTRRVFTPFAAAKRAPVYIPGTGRAEQPYVTMCQNLLPLETVELNRYFFSTDWLRLRLLRRLHRQAYRDARGVVFLNRYCLQQAEALVGRKIRDPAIIPHGLAPRFRIEGQAAYAGAFSAERPLRLVYVSIIDLYKHQWNVAEAVFQLVEAGIHVELDLIGPAHPRALQKLERVFAEHPRVRGAVRYHGAVSYDAIHDKYRAGDAFVFASSCETSGMVLWEAMAAGLPVLCSSMSSMPETVGDAALYFDPLSPSDAKRAIREIHDRPELRVRLAERSRAKTRSMSWQVCADETFRYLSRVGQA